MAEYFRVPRVPGIEDVKYRYYTRWCILCRPLDIHLQTGAQVPTRVPFLNIAWYLVHGTRFLALFQAPGTATYNVRTLAVFD